MSKLGFMQDLIRGIRKFAGTSAPQRNAAPISTTRSSNVENLMKRGMLSLEGGKWDDANEYFEQVLNENVEEPKAYLGMLMADLHLHTQAEFSTH